MSSSGRPPDWSAFAERDAPIDVEMISPAAELAAILQWAHARLEAAARSHEEQRIDGLKALAEQAVFTTQLAHTLASYEAEIPPRIYRHLRVLKDQMLDALGHGGLEIIDPLGKRFDEVAAMIDVVGWRHDERYEHEVVAEVIEPIVLSDGLVIRLGRVIMGAPAAQALPAETDVEPN